MFPRRLTRAAHDGSSFVAAMEMTITFPDPLRVAEGTYLIRPLGQAPGAPWRCTSTRW